MCWEEEKRIEVNGDDERGGCGTCRKRELEGEREDKGDGCFERELQIPRDHPFGPIQFNIHFLMLPIFTIFDDFFPFYIQTNTCIYIHTYIISARSHNNSCVSLYYDHELMIPFFPFYSLPLLMSTFISFSSLPLYIYIISDAY